jgi:hypothetical protein
MKKNTTTALSLPAQTMQPKPTKTEIINAMVTRAKVKHDAENERLEKVREGLQKKIAALALKATKDRKPHLSIYAYDDNRSSHVDVQFRSVKSEELSPLFVQYREASRLCWDERSVREAIKRQLDGIQKPSPTRLLENPETVKAMDAMLEQWCL